MVLQSIAKRISPAHQYIWPTVVLVGFAVSRVVYHACGIRFDAGPLTWFWQYLDPALLKANPVQSLLYLHSQPPLMNALLALVLRVFPTHETTAFHILYLMLGLSLSLGLFFALHRLGLGRTLSACASLLFMVSPACVLYENWLFYTYPIAALLVWAIVFLQLFLAHQRTRDAFGLFSALACACLTWSIFHLVWLIVCLVLLIVARRRLWRRILLGAAIPLLLVVGWYAKNLVVFGEFTATTWTGMNFSKMTNAMLTEAERRQLYEEGVISDLSLAPPFSDLETYGRIVNLPDSTGIPVLDQYVKQSGIVNFNHLAYIGISRQLGRDDIRVLARMPQAYLRGLAESYLNFFLPSSAYLFVSENRERICGLARIWDIIANGRFQYSLQPALRRTYPAAYYRRAFANIGFWILAAYLIAFVLGLMQFKRYKKQEADSRAQGRTSKAMRLERPKEQTRLVIISIWFLVFSVALIGNHTEVGENNRFRFVLDPLALVLLGYLLERTWSRLRPSKAVPRRSPRSRRQSPPNS